MDQQTREGRARALYQARRDRQQLEQFSKLDPTMTIDDSYAIQRAWMALEKADGRRVIGHKIGLTSRAMQQASQITEPDYGTLLDDMLIGDGSEIEPGPWRSGSPSGTYWMTGATSVLPSFRAIWLAANDTT